MQSIKKCGSKNPVFLLDEVDKMSSDFRGDPAAALLEVLDPEQNVAFSDHYLDVDFDLSEVMFITTANVLHTIPPALQDRMEIIRLPGYLDFEKLEIAKGFLVPKQLKAHGLDKENVSFSPQALTQMIRKYTREAGVRNLEREIANTCRKIARSIATPNKKGVRKVTVSNLGSFLGVPRYIEAEIASESCVGIATGLAWTKVGGEILHVEASIMPGDGELTLTGQLGDVMQESGQAALTYARANAARLGIDEKFLEKTDVHVHIPEGSIPKDGPSAGIAMATALISAITGIAVKPDVAMTGEIILRGEVLPVGGLNEKAVAAMRAGVTTLIIPKKNEKDVKELPGYIRKGLKIELVESMAQVLSLALDFSEKQTLPLLARKDKVHKESVGGYPH
jgi:ATP-dependent Lon protease